MKDIDYEMPAFPSHGSMGEVVFEGMNLRDYFAAKAMAAFIVTAARPCLNGLDGYEQYTAEAAYKMADVMIKARYKYGSEN